MLAWRDATFKGKPIPFGVFVDPYTVLQSIILFAGGTSQSAVKEMKVRRDINVSTDKAIPINNFGRLLPKLSS